MLAFSLFKQPSSEFVWLSSFCLSEETLLLCISLIFFASWAQRIRLPFSFRLAWRFVWLSPFFRPKRCFRKVSLNFLRFIATLKRIRLGFFFALFALTGALTGAFWSGALALLSKAPSNRCLGGVQAGVSVVNAQSSIFTGAFAFCWWFCLLTTAVF